MSRLRMNPKLMLLLLPTAFLFAACSEKDEEPPQKSDVWDIDQQGIPHFVNQNYIELDKIYRISKFRSSVGHDYSDAFEHCRSMKHYFEPLGTVNWCEIKIFSPVAGTITRNEMEWAGVKIEIESAAYPAFRFSIFHVNLAVMLNPGDTVKSGQFLGTHIGSQTMSDISVIVNDPTHQGKMVSYFDVMSDSVFNGYTAKGVLSRSNMIISRSLRDSSAITCNGDTFTSSDTLENWVVLK